jgi:hypothetical protein
MARSQAWDADWCAFHALAPSLRTEVHSPRAKADLAILIVIFMDRLQTDEFDEGHVRAGVIVLPSDGVETWKWPGPQKKNWGFFSPSLTKGISQRHPTLSAFFDRHSRLWLCVFSLTSLATSPSVPGGRLRESNASVAANVSRGAQSAYPPRAPDRCSARSAANPHGHF